MTAVDRKAHVIRLKLAVTRQGQLPTPFFVRFKIRARRSEERITTLGAEKVWFMVCPLPKRGVIETDEPLFDDSSFTMVAARCKVLQNITVNLKKKTRIDRGNEPRGSRDGNMACRHAHKSLHAPKACCTSCI